MFLVFHCGIPMASSPRHGEATKPPVSSWVCDSITPVHRETTPKSIGFALNLQHHPTHTGKQPLFSSYSSLFHWHHPRTQEETESKPLCTIQSMASPPYTGKQPGWEICARDEYGITPARGEVTTAGGAT